MQLLVAVYLGIWDYFIKRPDNGSGMARVLISGSGKRKFKDFPSFLAGNRLDLFFVRRKRTLPMELISFVNQNRNAGYLQNISGKILAEWRLSGL